MQIRLVSQDEGWWQESWMHLQPHAHGLERVIKRPLIGSQRRKHRDAVNPSPNIPKANAVSGLIGRLFCISDVLII
jgi:hypothetical protein